MAMLVWTMFVFTGMVGPVLADDVAGQLPPYTVVSLTGETVALHESRGRVTVLNIWATWCGPCRKEMPSLQVLHQKFQERGLEVVGVNVDAQQADQLKRIQELTQRLGIDYTILLDPEQKFVRTFRAIGVPQTLLIDRSGRILRHWRGAFDPMAADVVTLIERALSQAP
jgi:peroxiredoxin